MLNPPPFGALTQLWAGTSPEAIHENGKVCCVGRMVLVHCHC